MHEVGVLRHVGDDARAGVLEPAEPRVLHRPDELNHGEPVAPGGQPVSTRTALAAERHPVAPRVDGAPTEPDCRQIVAPVSAGAAQPPGRIARSFREREGLVVGQDACAGRVERRRTVRRGRHDEDVRCAIGRGTAAGGRDHGGENRRDKQRKRKQQPHELQK